MTCTRVVGSQLLQDISADERVSSLLKNYPVASVQNRRLTLSISEHIFSSFHLSACTEMCAEPTLMVFELDTSKYFEKRPRHMFRWHGTGLDVCASRKLLLCYMLRLDSYST